MLFQIGVMGEYNNVLAITANSIYAFSGMLFIYGFILALSLFTGKGFSFGGGDSGKNFWNKTKKAINWTTDLFNKNKKDDDAELDITDKEIPEIENEENMEKRLAGLQTRELKTEMQCIEYLKELKSIIDYVQKSPAEIGKYAPEIKKLFERIKANESFLMKFDVYSEKMMKRLWQLEQIEEKQARAAEKLTQDERTNDEKVANEFLTGEKSTKSLRINNTIKNLQKSELKNMESIYAYADRLHHKTEYLNKEKLKLIKENLMILRNKDKLLRRLQVAFNENLKVHKILMTEFNALESDIIKVVYPPALEIINKMIQLLSATIQNGKKIEQELGLLLKEDNILLKSWNEIHNDIKKEEDTYQKEYQMVDRLKLEEKKEEGLIEKDKKEIEKAKELIHV